MFSAFFTKLRRTREEREKRKAEMEEQRNIQLQRIRGQTFAVCIKQIVDREERGASTLESILIDRLATLGTNVVVLSKEDWQSAANGKIPALPGIFLVLGTVTITKYYKPAPLGGAGFGGEYLYSTFCDYRILAPQESDGARKILGAGTKEASCYRIGEDIVDHLVEVI